MLADWNMKGLGMNQGTNNHKTNSDLPMFNMGTTTSCNGQNIDENQQPKLENFLGGCHSFANHEHNNTMYDTTADYMFRNSSVQLPSDHPTTNDQRTSDNGRDDSSSINNSSIGLSMIKTWLRNQPAPTTQLDQTSGVNINKNNGGGGGGGAQSLSLSMSTGSQSGTPLLPLANGIGGDHSSASENNKQQKSTTSLDSQTGAIEAVPRKSIDTFGQRTSIYRGVTRSMLVFLHNLLNN